MEIKEVFKIYSQKLKKTSLKTVDLDLAIILTLVLKKPKEFLYTYPEKKLTKPQIKKLEILIKKRLHGKPLAYLRNLKEFYGLEFYVDKRVLIPRPDTELLAETVLLEIREPACRQAGKKSEVRNQKVVIADIGTGSGCVAIALAKNSNQAKILAADISKSAILVAKKNAKKHRVKINFFQGDLLQPVIDKKIDIIVANLPYGWPQWEKSTPQTNSLKFEPKLALFTKEKGLFLYQKLFGQIAKKSNQPKIVAIEFDPRQTKALLKLTKKILPNYRADIKKDLAGKNRVLILKSSDYCA
ncbi:MAG: peptide chain release factor N(5)-glutamine methyltransferase [Candidatus Buchananbacteria bacterium]